MNVLYYCIEYHRAFGPSTHAREFFAALQEHPTVEYSKVVPEESQRVSVGRFSVNNPSTGRKLIRLLTPEWLRLLVLFMFPKKEAWNLLATELASGKWDAIVMRSDWAIGWVPRLKREFPHVCVALEVNSAMFDELPKRIPFRWFWRRVEVRMMNAADLIFTVSTWLKSYLVQYGATSGKIHVNPNGVNLGVFDPARFSCADQQAVRESFGVPKETFLFGYVGGMQSFRRLPQMVSAFSEWAQTVERDVALLVVGDGEDMEGVRSVYESLPQALQARVVLAGAKPYREVPGIMSAFDAAIFPYSNLYGSPQKIFEYMAMGLPVIGPEVPVMEETFQNDTHLLLCDQAGQNAFERCLGKCLNHPEQTALMAERGMAYVLAEYTWRENADRVCSRLRKFEG